MQGIADCLDAIGHAAAIGAARLRLAELQPVHGISAPVHGGAAHTLDEVAAKRLLANFGVTIPRGVVVTPAQAAAQAQELGFPVVVKAVSAAWAHKTEAGAVRLNLHGGAAVAAAVRTMAHLSDHFLVEHMVQDVVAELIVGVRQDASFGLTLTLGAGGVLVELLQDTTTLLLPASRADIHAALASLRCWPLVTGYRGRPGGDVDALLDAVQAILVFAHAHAGTLLELDVNPLLVLPQGQGVVAVDALIRLAGEGLRHG
jgi:acetyl-CoA synthetase